MKSTAKVDPTLGLSSQRGSPIRHLGFLSGAAIPSLSIWSALGRLHYRNPKVQVTVDAESRPAMCR